MQSDPTTPPKRIWADPPETFDGMDMWRSEPGGKGVPYIRASEVAALIAEAEARGMERAAELALSCGIAVNANQRDAIAAAIRAAKGETT